MSLDTFTRAYVECALWSSTDDDGEPLDAFCNASDIAPATLASMASDCADFRELAGELLADWTDEQAGHDFWLTRNGHGAGFWDRGKSAGDKLTALCKPYGSVDLYIGDDGLVYSM